MYKKEKMMLLMLKNVEIKVKIKITERRYLYKNVEIYD
ncbi:hypothetical protein B0I63_001892 [Clostridium beijerinckii]|jgi:hypothetical protein|nr:hypothetical protein [Clostridium beijerinckii]NRT09253.1 hypothetical protein [Clostridium beijerinckii]NRT39610.1 hypothetical protein [Clostridium beijerinckii]NRT50617.1 hypothetical protein [Clostridium beijerinckii]NRU01398.1 hypothetical protein [Clostridium beijerinckii]